MSLTLTENTNVGLKPSTQQASNNEQLSATRGAEESAISSEQSQVTYVPAGAGQAYKSPIDQVTILLTGEQTGGAIFMAEAIVPPGCGNPPHIHARESETFYVQQGTLNIQVGDKTLNALPGDVVRLPRNVVHSFKNTGNVNARVLVVAEPAGLEQCFEEAFYPDSDWPDAMPPMNDAFMARIITAAQKCGLTFLPPA
jgi:quercetin dioxygenase-like cupin family protein